MEVLTRLVWEGKYWGGCNLVKKLMDNSTSAEISKKFNKLGTEEQRVKYVDGILRNMLNGTNETNTKWSMLKSKEMSKELRNKGNMLYKEKKFNEALRAYSLSLCFSPEGSPEFYFAIANRSAVYFEIGRYKNCKKDLEIVFSKDSDSDEIVKLKQRLRSRLEKCDAELLREEEYPEEAEVPKPLPWFALRSPNSRIPSAEDFIEIQSSPERGRHVVTTKDISPGTTVIVEDPFAKVLLRECLWDVEHCHTCLRNVENGTSCSSCVFAIFCSSECRDNHDRYMCEISSMLHTIRPSRCLLLATKIVTHQGPKSLYELFLKPKQPKSEEPAGFDNGVYSSTSYQPILNLIHHEQTPQELLQYTVEACVVVNLLWRFSSFFENYQEEEFKVFICKLIILHQRNLPPNAHSVNELIGYDMVEYGVGAYALLSLINHSCDPNVTRFNLPDGKIAIVSVRSIPSGSEILDNYGVHYAVTELGERQKHLLDNYYFDCACPPCVENWPIFTQLKDTLGPIVAHLTDESYKTYDEMCSQFDVVFDNVMHDQTVDLNELFKCLEYFESNFKLPFAKINEIQETFKHHVNSVISRTCGTAV